MGRSRHGHRVAPVEGGGLPSWAQRHLGEAGEADEALTVATPSPIRHRRRAAPEPTHRLKGWGVAVVSVAAAVGAVPLAISSVAADRSDDPLPTVNTFTAGAPGPLESGGAGQGGVAQGGTRTVTVPAPPGDPSTGGILEGPAGAPGAPGVPGAGPAAAVPQPAAVVTPTVPAASSTTTAPARPLAGTSTTAPKPKPTTTTGGSGGSSDDDEPRTATKPSAPTKQPASSSGSSQPSGGSGGLLPAVGKAAGGVVNGLTDTVGGLL